MAGKLEIDRESEDERRSTGRLSVNQGFSLMFVGVIVSIAVQSIPGLELLPRLVVGAVAVIVAVLVGSRIIRRWNLHHSNSR